MRLPASVCFCHPLDNLEIFELCCVFETPMLFSKNHFIELLLLLSSWIFRLKTSLLQVTLMQNTKPTPNATPVPQRGRSALVSSSLCQGCL